MSKEGKRIRVAVTQLRCSDDRSQNVHQALQIVRDAANAGAEVILLQELFESLYFCQEQNANYFGWAHDDNDDAFFQPFADLAKELHVVIPVSFFERANNTFFNSIVVFDADGTKLGKYRKSHIPDGPGYMEKFYFSPGDTGFVVFDTRYCKLGIGICWDQWFPETARAMVLKGAEVLLYPTAIGSETSALTRDTDSQPHWRRVMIGHAAANMVPVVASNRVGREEIGGSTIDFYGSSFVCDHRGELVVDMDRSSEGFRIAEIDLAQSFRDRYTWGLFRDRRTDLYKVLLTKDGTSG